MIETKTIIATSGYIPLFILGVSTELTMILAILLIIDTFTGIISAYYSPDDITSSRMTRGIISKLLLLLIPFVIVLTGKGAGLDLKFLASGTIGMLCLAECYSIIGNIYHIRTKKKIKEFDAISFILKKINQMLESLIKK